MYQKSKLYYTFSDNITLNRKFMSVHYLNVNNCISSNEKLQTTPDDCNIIFTCTQECQTIYSGTSISS